MTRGRCARIVIAYLGVVLPLASACAEQADTLEDEPAAGRGGSANPSAGSGGAAPKAGSASNGGKAGSGSTAFGGSASAGTTSGGQATSGAGGMAGSSSGASNGGASSGGASSGSGGMSGAGGKVGVPPDVLANASAVVHYQTDKATPATSVIFMKLFIENKSDDPLPMANVKVRYWLTAEATPNLQSFYHGASVSAPALSFVAAAADSHVLFTFTGSSLTKGADLSASEFQLQVDGGAFDQSDDYSWQPAYATRMPHDKITLYLADKLVWGCEPSGACPEDGTGGAGGGG